MKKYTKANKLNTISMLALLWLGSFGVFGQVSQQPEWKWQNPFPTGNHLYDVQFLDSLNGWAIGDFGTLLKTSNSGLSWHEENIGNMSFLRSIHFSDSQNGWIVGGDIILKTTNGGNSWQIQPNPNVNATSFSSVYFINSQVGIIGCGNLSGTFIIRTTNGGLNWSPVTNLLINNIGISEFSFTDPQNGWVVLFGSILRTSNGGANWQPQIIVGSEFITTAYFVDSLKGWAVSATGGIWKTTDGGNNWGNQISYTNNHLTNLYFTDTSNGVIIGKNGTILKTSNGGDTWQTQISETTFDLKALNFSNAQTGWAVGENGTIIKTTNGGSTWLNQTSVTANWLQSVHFSDAHTGWAVGYNGTILKTSSGGSKWQSQNSGTTNYLFSVHFKDVQNGWAVGVNTILKTTNGGSNWSSSWSNYIGLIKLWSVHFSDSQTGWAVGDYGTILKTTNDGITWLSQNSGTTNVLYSVRFTNAQNGWAVGSNGTILKTGNGGSNWQIQNSGLTKDLYSVHFSDAQIGWAVGIFGTILKTSNGGSSWSSQSSGSTNMLRSVHFINTQNGWIMGDNGTILKTSNAGISWLKQSSGTANTLSSVHFTDALHGWAVGQNGTILTNIKNNPISPETPSTLLTGNLFEKTTANCNPSNIPVPNQLVKALPGPYYGISNNQGNYKLRLPLSDTTIQFTLQSIENQNPAFNFEAVCPPNNQYNINLDTIPDTLSNKDFGFEITPCHHLDVQIASNRRRRCFQNTTSISYQNQGSLSAPDAYLLVEFPHWVRPVSASRSHVALSDSVWRFNLDTVSAGESGSFTITDSVICGNLGILGLSQCTKATIFPAPDCPPPPGYSGAEVTVSGKCNDGFVNLGIYNKSNTDMADSVNYWVYLDSIQVKQAKVKLAAGDSLKLWVETQGWAVHLTVNQVQNHPTELFVSTTVESCGDTFIFYPRQTVNRFAKQQTPSSKTHCLEIRGSYDPNDKQAFPIGFTNQNIIPPNTQLEYLVRFQNTGNDTAFTVYVIDTLDTNLNLETIELGASSHNYQLSMQTVKSGKTFLRWQFNNIQLPDSNTNKLKSNGFIQYRISPKANLALGTKVRNHAEIYFDFNPPIITNQTLTTYNVITFRDTSLNNNVQIVTASKGKLSPKQIGVNLYPNPVTEHSLTADFQTKGSLTLFNAQGQLVYEKLNIEGKQVLPIQLRTGFYMAQFRTEKGVSVVKVVVE